MGSCVLFASLRLQAAAAVSGGGGGGSTSPTPPPENARQSTILPSAKRAKSPKSDVVGGSSKKKGLKAVASDETNKSLATPPEAEGLIKEGKVDVSGLRSALLGVAEAVPEKAWRPGQWRRVSYPAWRAFVFVATGPRELMQVWRDYCSGGGGMFR